MCSKLMLFACCCSLLSYSNCFNKSYSSMVDPVISFGRYYPKSQVRRVVVPDDLKSWDKDFPDYQPLYYDSPNLDGKVWADPKIEGRNKDDFVWNMNVRNKDRRSFTGNYSIDSSGFPLNPTGRTGIRGRGLLGKWGPNHAADPVVTKWKRDNLGNIVYNQMTNKPILEIILIKRKDNMMWALPGGMVDAGEDSMTAAIREFFEETTDSLNRKESGEIIEFKKIIGNETVVCKEYVDDPRNTDNAWIESSVYNFHDELGDTVSSFNYTAGDDAIGVKWTDINNKLDVHPAHLRFISKVAHSKAADW